MLTCNKNFVDVTVWILWNGTCIKLNVMLHRSLEKERARRKSDTSGQDQTKPILTPDCTKPDRTRFIRTEKERVLFGI